MGSGWVKKACGPERAHMLGNTGVNKPREKSLLGGPGLITFLGACS